MTVVALVPAISLHASVSQDISDAAPVSAAPVSAVPADDSQIDLSPGGPGAVDPCWAEIDGRPLLWYAVRHLRAAGVNRVLVLVDPGREAAARKVVADPFFGGVAEVMTALDRRSAVQAALERLGECGEAVPAAVLVHDPARAFAPVPMIRRVIDAVRRGASAVVPVLPVVDTIRAVDAAGVASRLLDRDALRIVQTPQGFAAGVLDVALEGSGPAGTHPLPATDDLGLVVAAGYHVATVAGDADAARVVTAADLARARHFGAPRDATPDHRLADRGVFQ